MTVARRIAHIARADFLERVRRYGFLVTLLACVYAGYAFLPPNPSRYVTLMVEGHRGIYNSAWVGAAMAMLSACFISMVGFFVVKNTIERDRRTGVGQILAATPVSRLEYTVGKTFSNFLVLSAMAGVVAVLAGAMQWIRAEDTHINLYHLLMPFVVITLPALFVTSAIAVFFEAIPGLRGGIGNVVYFFAWGGLLGGNFSRGFLSAHNDLLGTGIVLPSMLDVVRTQVPGVDVSGSDFSMGVNIRESGEWLLTLFHWDGVNWTAQHLLWRLSWVGLGLVIAAAAAIPFDRFDPARARVTRARGRFRRKRAHAHSEEPILHASTHAHAPAHLTPLSATTNRARPFALLVAEWKLLTRGLRWWYVGPIACLIAALTAPLSGVRAIVLPLAWAWPVLLWSRLGTRETTHGTEPVFFSSPHPLSRQLFATWLAGVGLSVLAGGAVAVRLAVAGEIRALLAWCVGALFIPSLALALGVWTRSTRFFEALYLCLCYAVIQAAVPIDFMGATDEAVADGRYVTWLVITIILVALAWFGRSRQLRN